MTDRLRIHYSSSTPEHYTPTHVVAAVVRCLGAIDLDPCADPGHRIPARLHYTEDGLDRPWLGRVYMNPPYGRQIGQWVNRLCCQYELGNVTEGIALLPARTDTRWWQLVRDYEVCFVTGRLTFIGNDAPAPFPSAVVYLGNDIDAFCESFGDLGDIWQRVSVGNSHDLNNAY